MGLGEVLLVGARVLRVRRRRMSAGAVGNIAREHLLIAVGAVGGSGLLVDAVVACRAVASWSIGEAVLVGVRSSCGSRS